MAHQADDHDTAAATRRPHRDAPVRRRATEHADRLRRLAGSSGEPERYRIEVGRPEPSGHVQVFLPHVLDEVERTPRALTFTPTQARELWHALDVLIQPEAADVAGEADTSAEVGIRAVADLLTRRPAADCAEVAAHAGRQARAAHLAPGMAAFHAWLEAADNGRPEPGGTGVTGAQQPPTAT